MKNLAILFIMLTTLACSEKSTEKKKYSIQIINSWAITRLNEPVVVKRESLQDHEANKGKFVVIANSDGEIQPYQLDDIDGDGQWDELFFLVDAKPKDTLIIGFEYRDTAPNIKFRKRANVRFGSKQAPFQEISNVERLPEGNTKITSQIYQMEGPAWENDIVGFRNYFDARNGMDIFGKQTDEMVLDSAGINGQNYHALDDWGMDILKVGNSLGAGGIALMKDDSIYRWSPSGKGSYRLIADGPLRAMLELSYEGWKIDSGDVNLKHRISLWAGANFYKSEITVDTISDGLSLVTGIVNLHSDTLYVGDFEKEIIIATHDLQAENQAHLGMAIIMHKADYITNFETPKEGPGVTNTYVANLAIKEGQAISFYFFAGWENQNSKFDNHRYLLPALKETADKLRLPLLVE